MPTEAESQRLKALIQAKNLVIESLKAQVEELTARCLFLQYNDFNCRCGEPLCPNPACKEINKSTLYP